MLERNSRFQITSRVLLILRRVKLAERKMSTILMGGSFSLKVNALHN